MNAILARPVVKSAAVVVFHPAFTRRMINPAFGRLPQRERRLPIGPSAADLAEVKGACPATAPTFIEEMDRFYSQTMSRAEFAAFTANARSAEMDALARESAEMDRVWRGPVL